MKKVSKLLNGNKSFKDVYFKTHEIELINLVENGQNPKALFIGCSDSRVIPSLITQTRPGDLFVLRNVGNFVAPYKEDSNYHSTGSGVEYSVLALGVEEIIICGHTHCGAIGSLYKELSPEFGQTKKWLELGDKAKTLALSTWHKKEGKEVLLRMTEKLSVVSQIENLLTYPFVKERVDSGKLFLHGWMYDISSGEIEYYCPDEKTFKTLKDIK